MDCKGVNMTEIKVILGENGQGKTRYLLNYFNENVHCEHIAVVSNSIINPFPLIRENSHHYYGLRSRNNHTQNVSSRNINDYFVRLITDNSLRGLLSLCKLIGYDDEILVRREPLYRIKKIEGDNNLYHDSELAYTPYGKERYKHLQPYRRQLNRGILEKYASYIEKSHDYYLAYNDNGRENQSFNDHIKYENEVSLNLGLGRFRPLFANRVFVSKNNKSFPIENASSGELYMLSFGLFLRKFLDERKNNLPKVILIDEPENSLHPKWQRKYIEFLIGFLGYNDDIKVIIATHSPFITMENDFYSADFSLCGIQDGVIFDTNHRQKNNNIEQVYYELFGILTPKNRYLSDYCNKLVRGVAEKRILFNDAHMAISGMKSVAFDRKQYDFLNDVINLLEKVHGDLND